MALEGEKSDWTPWEKKAVMEKENSLMTKATCKQGCLHDIV